jgi:hypothetical protein
VGYRVRLRPRPAPAYDAGWLPQRACQSLRATGSGSASSASSTASPFALAHSASVWIGSISVAPFPFEHVADAHRLLDGGHPQGKLVLTV